MHCRNYWSDESFLINTFVINDIAEEKKFLSQTRNSECIMET